MTTAPQQHITGVILAGGRAERMGGRDKGLVLLAGEPLIAHSVRRLRPQVAEVLISANRNLELYQSLGCRVVCDADQEFRGPLAGILAALRAATTPYLLTAPCDSPLLPVDYAQRMWLTLEQKQATVSVAYGEECWQPMFALLPVGLCEALAVYLACGKGNVGRWLQRYQPAAVEFPGEPGLFRNVNTPEELASLETDWLSMQENPQHG